ncbi:MAG: hypothetical protein JOZ05_24140 [Acetobacteraceae bacterium]|nr:hypothetical protein [Acetobacteraceae bacterium]
MALGMLFFAMLYQVLDRGRLVELMSLWGFRPWEYPFLDTETVMSALRCLRQGVDVFVANPCDPLERVYDYSPLWRVLAVFPVTQAWLAPVGVCVDIAFISSLLLLPAARDRVATSVIIAGLVSTSVVFAVERGNNDLIIFALVSCAAALAGASRVPRLIGYGLIFLAGLLKYYPMLLMVTVARERPKTFLSIAAASVFILAVLLAIGGHDLARALALIPIGPYFGDLYGAKNLPAGIADLSGSPEALVPYGQLVLSVLAFAAGVILGCRDKVRRDLAVLSAPEQAFLLAGALLIVGSFFTAQNIGYRAVHLILALSGLTALWRAESGRRFYGIAAFAVLFLLWSEGFRTWLGFALDVSAGSGSGWKIRRLFWLGRELLWWGLVILLIEIATSMLLRSDAAMAIGGWLQPSRRTPAR